MTRSKPTAVTAIISAEMISVPQAAACMTRAPFRSAEQTRDGPGVPDRADRHSADRLVGGSERLRYAVKLADQGDTAREYVVRCRPDPFECREHPVDQRDHHRQDRDEQH